MKEELLTEWRAWRREWHFNTEHIADIAFHILLLRSS